MRFHRPPTDLDAALRDLSDPAAVARVRAADALGRTSAHDPRRQQIGASLRQALDDASPDVRHAAALALGELGDREAVPRLAQMVAGDPEPMPRQGAISALGQIGDARAAGPLLRALDSGEADERFQATAAVCLVAPERAEAHLRVRLTDEDPEVRASAAAALGDLEAHDAVDDLAELLSDPVAQVRAEASVALARLADPRAVEPLARLLDDNDYGPLAAEQVFRRPAPAATSALLRMLSRWFAAPAVKVFCAGALARLGEHAGREYLVRAVHSRRTVVRGLAVHVLGRLGQPWSHDKLNDLAASGESGGWAQWREEIAEALHTSQQRRKAD